MAVSEVDCKPGLLSYGVALDERLVEGIEIGASISIDGVCQTVVELTGNPGDGVHDFVGGILATNGKIYSAPRIESLILEIDPKASGTLSDTITLSPYFNKF